MFTKTATKPDLREVLSILHEWDVQHGGERNSTYTQEYLPHIDLNTFVHTDYGTILIYHVDVGALDHGAGEVTLIVYHDGVIRQVDLLYEADHPVTIYRKES